MKGMKGGVLREGLSTRSPRADDASTKLKGPSVNAEATRGGKTAPTPATLGPRTA
jgi:hypothetical protein